MGGKGPQVPQSSIDANVNLQNTEADLLKLYSGEAMPALTASTGYWQNIMAGGDKAQQATAPYAQKIQAQSGVTEKNIMNNLPAGGERNLAVAQNKIQTGTNIADLYQNLGPTAATNLAQIGLGVGGLGNSAGGVSASAGAANEQLAASQAQAKGSKMGGIGAGLGSMAGAGIGAAGAKGAAATMAMAV